MGLHDKGRRIPRQPNLNGRCTKCGRSWDDHNLKGKRPACVPPKDIDD